MRVQTAAVLAAVWAWLGASASELEDGTGAAILRSAVSASSLVLLARFQPMSSVLVPHPEFAVRPSS